MSAANPPSDQNGVKIIIGVLIALMWISTRVDGQPTTGASAVTYTSGLLTNGGIYTMPITTQLSGSALIAWVGTQTNLFTSSFSPTDTFNNTFTMVAYHSFGPTYPTEGESLLTKLSASGGSNDTFYTGDPGSHEMTTLICEVRNAAVFQDIEYQLAPFGASNTSASVTTTGPATLVSIWAGDASGGLVTAVPNNGFNTLQSQLDSDAAYQAVMASKDVSGAGTYSVTWAVTPSQGAHIWLLAVQGGVTPPQGPTVTISTPTNGATVTNSSLLVSGMATDSGRGNNGVSSVTVNGISAAGGTATGSGTANWSATLTLVPGTNTITVVANDSLGNAGQQQITVTYSPPDTQGPTVTISTPANGATVTNSSLLVSGTATDSGRGNNGVSSVTVNGISATGGTVSGSGTANWSATLTLLPGTNTITVVANDSLGNAGQQQITVTYSPPDTQGPTVTVSIPANGATVTNSSLVVSGTATDSGRGNDGVSSVTVNGISATGGTASGSGTANWSATLTLVPGTNTITVVADDSLGNTGQQQITVTYSPPDTQGPTVTISAPTNGATVTSSSLVVSGTATDSGRGNNGVSSVTVNGISATGGTASGSGTANWSATLTLVPGTNTITVVANDSLGKAGQQQITVTYSLPDTQGPTVAISTPTNGATVTNSSLFVSGTATDSGRGNDGVSWVTVNGISTAGGTASGSGTVNWSVTLTLVPGTNTITAVAQDTLGNTGRQQITVTYTLPDLAGNLAITNLGNGSVAIGGYGVPGKSYMIQYTGDIPTASWLTLGAATADPSGAFILVDTNVSKLRFYHAVYP
jgi:5,10-methylenetetrahydrofolate reductase